jgi:pyrroline-5-carboxylate reductase
MHKEKLIIRPLMAAEGESSDQDSSLEKWIFFGAGRMVSLMLQRWIQNPQEDSVFLRYYPHPSFSFYTPTGESAEKMAKMVHGHVVRHLHELSDQYHCWFLACKPQQFATLAQDLRPMVSHPSFLKPSLVISMMASVSVAHIRKSLSLVDVPIVRLMPQTSVQYGRSATLYYGEFMPPFLDRWINRLCHVWGQMVEVKEEFLIDDLTPLTGSGPAYFFYLLETLQGYYIKKGYSPQIITQLLQQTLTGVHTQVANHSPSSINFFEEQRKNVSSKGGITEAVLKQLDEHDWSFMWEEALRRGERRSSELSSLIT